MAGSLTAVESRILGGYGAAARSAASVLCHRAGMGLPVGSLPVNEELVGDNGTPFLEPCVDRLAPHIGNYEALAWLHYHDGLSFFAGLGLVAAASDKASKTPDICDKHREFGSKLAIFSDYTHPKQTRPIVKKKKQTRP